MPFARSESDSWTDLPLDFPDEDILPVREQPRAYESDIQPDAVHGHARIGCVKMMADFLVAPNFTNAHTEGEP